MYRRSLGDSRIVAARHGRRGLTLTELLVVLLLLGLIASSVTTSVSYTLARARERDVAVRLMHSWKLARVYARALQQPVLWEIRKNGEGASVAIATLGGDLQRQLEFERWDVRVEAGPAAASPGVWRVKISPDGLSESIVLQVVQGEKVLKVKLFGGIIAESALGAAAHGEFHGPA